MSPSRSRILAKTISTIRTIEIFGMSSNVIALVFLFIFNEITYII